MGDNAQKTLTRRQKDIVRDFIKTLSETDFIEDFVSHSSIEDLEYDEALEACEAFAEIGVE